MTGEVVKGIQVNTNLNQTAAAILSADEETLLYTLHCYEFLGDAEMSFQQAIINLHHSSCHHHLLQHDHVNGHNQNVMT